MDRFNPREDKIQKIYEGMSPVKLTLDNEIENFIRDTLSGKARKTTADLMWTAMKKSIKGATQSKLNKIWKSLIKDGYLVKAGGDDSYKWEM